MALQDLTKQEIQSLISGAKAANAIVARIAKDDPEEMPKDEIRQFEIAALYYTEVIQDVLAIGLKRRLEAGATVQSGPYYLEPDIDTIEDLEENQREYQGGSFNTVGFSSVGWNDPAAPKPEATIPAKGTKKVGRRSAQKSAKRGGRK